LPKLHSGFSKLPSLQTTKPITPVLAQSPRLNPVFAKLPSLAAIKPLKPALIKLPSPEAVKPINFKSKELAKLNIPIFNPQIIAVKPPDYIKPQELPVIAIFEFMHTSGRQAINFKPRAPLVAPIKMRLPANKEPFVKLNALKEAPTVFKELPAKAHQPKQLGLVDTYIKELSAARFDWHKLHNEFIALSRNAEILAEQKIIEADSIALAKEKLDIKTKEVTERFGETIVRQLTAQNPPGDRSLSAAVLVNTTPFNNEPVVFPLNRDAGLPLEPLRPAQAALLNQLGSSSVSEGFLENLRDMFKRNLLLAVAMPRSNPNIFLEADSGDILRLRNRNSFSGEHAGGVR
jgi:hypothetical protein